MFKLIGPSNPPKKGSLIIAKTKSHQRMGTIVKARAYGRNAKGDPVDLEDPENTMFWASKNQTMNKATSGGYSPFGDVAYQLEIVWVDDQERKWWVLEHPEPDSVGEIAEEQDDVELGVKVAWVDLPQKVTVLVA